MYKRASRAAGTGRHLVTTIMNVTVVLLAGNVKIVRWTVRLHCPPQQWVTESCRTAGTFSCAHLGWMRESNRGPFGFFFFFYTGTLTYAAPPAGCQDYISAAAGGRETVPLVQTLVTRDHWQSNTVCLISWIQLIVAKHAQTNPRDPCCFCRWGWGSRFSCFSSLTFSLWASQSSTYFRLTSLQPCIYKTGRSSKRLGK